MTGRDLISASLRKIGALASGESLPNNDATDSLAELNRMLGRWSNEGLLIYGITQEAPLTITSGIATYTLGALGSITTRPQSIERALIRDGDIDYPVRCLTLTEFAQIRDKALTSTYPYALYDDGGYPQRTITLYPVPAAAKQLVLFTKRALTAVTLDGTISLPPGYEDALVYNLAVRLAPDFGRPLPDPVALIASETKADLKRANTRVPLLHNDAIPHDGRRYNILTDGY